MLKTVDVEKLANEIARLEKRLHREKNARKQAEGILEEKSRELYELNAQLKEETRLIEAAVVNANDGVMVTTADLENGPEIIYVNEALTKITGYSKEELIGKTPRMLQGPETDRSELERLKATLTNGESFKGELKNYAKDGTPYWLGVSIVPVKDEEGKTTHFAAMERDITERKQFEKDLISAQKKAETANEAKSEFLANMSHELRTPMNGIIGLSDLLADTNLTSEQEESVKAINRSSEGLLVLLNDILDFSKIEAGEMNLEKVPFDFRQTAEDTINLLKAQITDKNVDLHFHYCRHVPDWIVGDPARIRQILTNLIGNAIKFTEKGNVMLDVSSRQCGDITKLYVRVEDTGVGIPKDRIDDIFKKFTQADESTSRRFGGTGLGLTICKKLIEMMDGQIGVDSIEGEGSTFWFEFPLGKCDDATITEAQKFAQENHDASVDDLLQFSNENVRVLVVDDHPVNLMFARKLLKKIGIDRVQLAGSGQEAFEYTQVCMYDAILMDCQMPDMDGFETTQAIRSMHSGQGLHTPIIAVTANAMKGDRERCIAAGMDDYLSKPIKPESLLNTLAKWIKAKPMPGDDTQEDLAENKEETQQESDCPVDLDHFNFMFEDAETDEIQMMRNLFDEQAEIAIKTLEEFCLDGEQEEWKKAAHKLKGSAANLGATDLSGACAEAEQSMEKGIGEKTLLLEKIKSEFQKLKTFLDTKM